MDRKGKFDHIEDVLSANSLFKGRGGWFGFSDIFNKSYENLIIHKKEYDKPTKNWLESELKKQQDNFDAQEYARNRAPLYPTIGDQLDLLWHAIDTGDWTAAKVKTTDFYTKLKKVKDDNPKPS